MIKVFLDSSVLVAAAGSQTGGSFKITVLCEERKLEGWVSEGVLIESEAAIKENFGEKKIKLFSNWIRSDFFKITSFPSEPELIKFKGVEVKDRHILAAAHIAKVSYLLSLDKKHVLTEKAQRALPKIKILSPKEFIQNYLKPETY